jgi:hypothetical protein
LKARSSFSSARQASSDLTTATVPAGTSFPAVSREACDLLMRYAAAFFIDQLNSVPSTHMRCRMTASFGRSGRASIRILGRKKLRAPSQADSRQQPVHSGIGDLASRLVFGNAAERPCAFGSPSVLQKLFHAVESQAFDKSCVDRLHRNDARPDWHQALRPNDGWSAYHRSDTTNKDAPAGKHRTT